jgi:hypothetical protein
LSVQQTPPLGPELSLPRGFSLSSSSVSSIERRWNLFGSEVGFLAGAVGVSLFGPVGIFASGSAHSSGENAIFIPL